MNARIAASIDRFPTGPGIYVFLGRGGKALYVGKAANLRERARSYLRPGGDGRPQLRFLESEAEDVEFLATRTEQEALLLENTVIKKRKPVYNVKLRDDKAFLLLRPDRREPWPWFRLVRRRADDQAEYFGPYASATAIRRTLRLLHKVVPLRDCRDAVFANRARPCLKHEIGRCPAPCVGLIERSAYDELLARACAILRGGAAPLLDELRRDMARAAAALEFERAQALKEQVEALAAVAERQQVVAAGSGDLDVVGLHRSGAESTLAVLAFRGGKLEQSRRFTVASEVPDELLLADFLGRFYAGDPYVPATVLVPRLPAEHEILRAWLEHKRGRRVELAVPERGARRRQLELAQANAQLLDAAAADLAARRKAGLARLEALLGSERPIERIHCLDVSTTQGKETVAARVGFAGGKPDKGQYRRFRIAPAHAADDFAAMGEAVRRSLALCLTRDDDELPDLLLVDGGFGQLGRAVEVVRELGLEGEVLVAGLAKSRLKGVGAARRASGERLCVPGAAGEQSLRDGSPEMLLVAAIRDEAHRFAITYHRHLRGRIASELSDLPGVGPARRRALLGHFGSMTALRAASLEELQRTPGVPQQVAQTVFAALHQGASR